MLKKNTQNFKIHIELGKSKKIYVAKWINVKLIAYRNTKDDENICRKILYEFEISI